MDSNSGISRILSMVDAESYLGRSALIEQLLAHPKGNSAFPGIALLAPPAAGASELLAQVYDRLFLQQEAIIPFYYRVKREDLNGISAARRFLSEFLSQTIAFRAKDPTIIGASHNLQELSKLASARDRSWLDPLIDSILSNRPLDERSAIRQCLAAPFRVGNDAGQVFVLVDDIHNSKSFEGGNEFFDDLVAGFEQSRVPVVFSGYRRFFYGQTKFPQITLPKLTFADAGKMVEGLASRLGVSINEQTRDLISVQLSCRPAYISTFITSAHDAGAELSTFSWTEQFYTDEIFGGRLGRRFSSVFDRVSTNVTTQSRIVDLLNETLALENHRTHLSHWQDRLDLSATETRFVLELLHHNEIANFNGSEVTIDLSDYSVTDYIRSRSLLAAGDKPRALIIGEAMAGNVRRAPSLMTRFYRKHASVGLRGIMERFDGRQISPAVLHYTRYKNELKGLPREGVLKAIREDKSQTRLPRCVFAAATSAYYPRLDDICDPERSATAICVDDGVGETDIVWIAVEIDSKLEVASDVAEFWCDRLEMVAVHCNFDRYKVWLVATEGFDPDAMALLASRGAIGSSRQQAELLRDFLAQDTASEPTDGSDVYEFVVPMGGDTEMIAAHTVEEIARRHDFPPKVINQIKTALVEACINAAEHSLSPDRRIHQTFSVNAEKLTITVRNRGVRLSDNPQLPNPNAGRRGWGLSLMRSLMDDVNIEATDDGTTITMVKYVAAVRERASEPQLVD